MSSLSVKQSNINSNLLKSKFELKSKCEVEVEVEEEEEDGKNLNNKTSISLKSRILKLLFNSNDNNDNTNKSEISTEKNKKRGESNKTESDKNKAFNLNKITNDEETISGESNEEFISYKDIKAIFDEIDRKFGCEGGENWCQQLTNCEINSPIMETSDYGENEYDEVPIWEQNQNIPSLSFCIRVEDHSELKGESSFVLIHLSDTFTALTIIIMILNLFNKVSLV